MQEQKGKTSGAEISRSQKVKGFLNHIKKFRLYSNRNMIIRAVL